MFMKDIMGRRGGVLLYSRTLYQQMKYSYKRKQIAMKPYGADLLHDIQLPLESVLIGVVYRCPNITKPNNEKIHNAISEVSK